MIPKDLLASYAYSTSPLTLISNLHPPQYTFITAAYVHSPYANNEHSPVRRGLALSIRVMLTPDQQLCQGESTVEPAMLLRAGLLG